MRSTSNVVAQRLWTEQHRGHHRDPILSPIRDGACCDHDQVEHVVAERIAQPQEMSDIAVGDIRAQLDLHANNTVVAAFDSEINLLSSISGTQAIQRRSNAARYASPVVLAGT